MLQKLCVILVIYLISWQTFAVISPPKNQLFLVGGGLKTCSSMSLKNCTANVSKNFQMSKSAKKTPYYQITTEALNWIKIQWPFSADSKQQIVSLLTSILNNEKSIVLTRSQLKQVLRKYDNTGIVKQLNDIEYYGLLDSLEQPIFQHNKRIKEVVNLSASTNFFSTEIYQRFVAAAQLINGQQTPRILVLTASARDSFEAVDFYQAVFSQAGAEVSWLPLDATLNFALQQSGKRADVCARLANYRIAKQGSLRRELIYPDLHEQQLLACLQPQLLVDLVQRADGVFINGGDQSLTVKALLNDDGSDGEVLKLIRQKLAREQLVIGGTSAGTAVMSGGVYIGQYIPMISNGTSQAALVRGAKKDVLPTAGCEKNNQCIDDVLNDDLTFRASGGVKLFPWGVLDTHFSERGRQGRLAVLVKQTKSPFGFGVDEASALLVDISSEKQVKFEVIGQGGVYIVENNNDDDNKVNTHYITRDDKAKIEVNSNTLSIEIASWKIAPWQALDEKLSTERTFLSDRFKIISQVLCQSDQLRLTGLDVWQKQRIKVEVAKTEASISRFGMMKLKDQNMSYCSYQNYEMTF